MVVVPARYLRIGAGAKGQAEAGEAMRVRPDGRPLLAGSIENKTLPPIEDTGRFFAESAG